MEDLEKWPGVEQAYAFVVPSYQWMLARIEAADSRLHSMQVFILTVSTGVPAMAKAVVSTVTLTSPRLLGALAFAFMAVVIGVLARSSTRIVLADPALLCHKDWLRLPDRSFKYNMLHFAGKHFNKNAALVARKHRALAWMTGIFLGELLLLAVWIWSGGI